MTGENSGICGSVKMLKQADAVTDHTQIGLTREHYLDTPRRDVITKTFELAQL